MQDYRDLKVWEKAHHLTLDVYQATSGFPREELYGLTSQIRRSSASIPTNIAEGCGQGSRQGFSRFLQIAAGSACELEYQLLFVHDLELLSNADYDPLAGGVQELKRMLTSFIKTLHTPDRGRLRTDN